MSGSELHGVVRVPRGFEFLVAVARKENLGVIPEQSPVAIGLRPEEDLTPDEAVVRIDARIRLGAVAADAEHLVGAEDILRRGNEVFADAVRVGGHDHIATAVILALGGPGEADRAGRDAALAGDFLDHRVVHVGAVLLEFVATRALRRTHRHVARADNALGLEVAAEFCLLEKRVEFHLVAYRAFVRRDIAQEQFHGGAGVVRGADVDDFSSLLEFANLGPCLEERLVDVRHGVGIALVAGATGWVDIWPRPVVEVEIDFVDAEIEEGFLQRRRDIFRRHVSVPEFAGDEQFLAGFDVAFADGLANGLANNILILISAGGIEVAPPEADGLDRGVLHERLGPVGVESAIRGDRHGTTRGQFD